MELTSYVYAEFLEFLHIVTLYYAKLQFQIIIYKNPLKKVDLPLAIILSQLFAMRGICRLNACFGAMELHTCRKFA